MSTNTSLWTINNRASPGLDGTSPSPGAAGRSLTPVSPAWSNMSGVLPGKGDMRSQGGDGNYHNGPMSWQGTATNSNRMLPWQTQNNDNLPEPVEKLSNGKLRWQKETIGNEASSSQTRGNASLPWHGKLNSTLPWQSKPLASVKGVSYCSRNLPSWKSSPSLLDYQSTSASASEDLPNSTTSKITRIAPPPPPRLDLIKSPSASTQHTRLDVNVRSSEDASNVTLSSSTPHINMGAFRASPTATNVQYTAVTSPATPTTGVIPAPPTLDMLSPPSDLPPPPPSMLDLDVPSLPMMDLGNSSQVTPTTGSPSAPQALNMSSSSVTGNLPPSVTPANLKPPPTPRLDLIVSSPHKMELGDSSQVTQTTGSPPTPPRLEASPVTPSNVPPPPPRRDVLPVTPSNMPPPPPPRLDLIAASSASPMMSVSSQEQMTYESSSNKLNIYIPSPEQQVKTTNDSSPSLPRSAPSFPRSSNSFPRSSPSYPKSSPSFPRSSSEQVCNVSSAPLSVTSSDSSPRWSDTSSTSGGLDEAPPRRVTSSPWPVTSQARVMTSQTKVGSIIRSLTDNYKGNDSMTSDGRQVTRRASVPGTRQGKKPAVPPRDSSKPAKPVVPTPAAVPHHDSSNFDKRVVPVSDTVQAIGSAHATVSHHDLYDSAKYVVPTHDTVSQNDSSSFVKNVEQAHSMVPSFNSSSPTNHVVPTSDTGHIPSSCRLGCGPPTPPRVTRTTSLCERPGITAGTRRALPDLPRIAADGYVANSAVVRSSSYTEGGGTTVNHSGNMPSIADGNVVNRAMVRSSSYTGDGGTTFSHSGDTSDFQNKQVQDVPHIIARPDSPPLRRLEPNSGAYVNGSPFLLKSPQTDFAQGSSLEQSQSEVIDRRDNDVTSTSLRQKNEMTPTSVRQGNEVPPTSVRQQNEVTSNSVRHTYRRSYSQPSLSVNYGWYSNDTPTEVSVTSVGAAAVTSAAQADTIPTPVVRTTLSSNVNVTPTSQVVLTPTTQSAIRTPVVCPVKHR